MFLGFWRAAVVPNRLYCTQVIERLTERRIVVEKAVSTLGEAPQGLRDVFELCRGFEKAFSNIVNVSMGSAQQ